MGGRLGHRPAPSARALAFSLDVTDVGAVAPRRAALMHPVPGLRLTLAQGQWQPLTRGPLLALRTAELQLLRTVLGLVAVSRLGVVVVTAVVVAVVTVGMLCSAKQTSVCL